MKPQRLTLLALILTSTLAVGWLLVAANSWAAAQGALDEEGAGGLISSAAVTSTFLVAGGQDHSCAVTDDSGGLRCWGYNASGQLGDNSTDQSETPVSVNGLSSGIRAVDGGYFHSCSVTTCGEVKCWGANSRGQLGNGSWTQSLVPVDVLNSDDSTLSGAVAVGTGAEHSCALLGSGQVRCWGYNNSGQLGDDSSTNRNKAVVVTTTAGSPLTGIKAVVVGDYHSCALTTGGGVKCWGLNTRGQLGNDKAAGTEIMSKTPVDVKNLSSGVAAISAEYDHTCVVLTNGTGKCWGGNSSGQLGNNPPDTDWVSHAIPVIIESLSNAAAIAAGKYHTCALLSDGSIECWGYNSYGQLGRGTTGGPKETNYLPAAVSDMGSGSTALAIGLGNHHSCAMFEGYGVKCWGYNNHGQLGDDSIDSRDFPVHVNGLGDYQIEGAVYGCVDSGQAVVSNGAGDTVNCSGTLCAYKFDHLASGIYTLTVTNSGYTYTPAWQVVDLPPDASDIDFSCSATATVSGQVMDGDGQGIPGVTMACGSTPQTTTGPDGIFNFGVPYASLSTICKLKPSRTGFSFSPTSRNVTVPPDSGNNDFQGSSSGPTYSISGWIADVDGNPLGLVTVTESGGVSTASEGNGDYSLTTLVTGTYTFTPTKPGFTFSPGSRSASLPPDQSGKDFTATGQPNTKTIPSSGGQLKSPDGDVKIQLPDGAVETDTEVSFTPQARWPVDSGLTGTDYFFRLEAEQGSKTLSHFEKPVTIIIDYDAQTIGDVDPNTLMLYWWNGSQWTSQGITLVSHTGSTITFTVTQAGLYALLGQSAEQKTYLPILLRPKE